VQKYKVIGRCAVAGVAPGGEVTRGQVEAAAGPGGHVPFDVLVGRHLEPVADEPEPAKPEPKRAPK
jgi:hypothetical protein